MTPNESRLLAALLIGPMQTQQLAAALTMSLQWTHTTLRKHRKSHMVIRLISPHHVTGHLIWRYALTNRGTQIAHQRISA